MIIRTTNNIGFLIRETRTRQGMTQGDLAKRIGSTVKWVSHIENGKPTAEIGLVLQALVALGVEMDFRHPSIEPPPAHPDESPEDDVPYKL